MKNTDLKPEEYNEYFSRYINLVSDKTMLKEAFPKAKTTMLDFFNTIPEEKWNYKYAEGKWTIKEVLQHLIDTERIFAYRMLRIGRRDPAALVGFDQDPYIEFCNANQKTPSKLLQEYSITRDSSSILLESLTEEDLKFIGNASGHAMSARAAAFIILGHEIWHTKVVIERYL